MRWEGFVGKGRVCWEGKGMLGREGFVGRGRDCWEGKDFVGKGRVCWEGFVGKGRVCWEGTGLLGREGFVGKGRVCWEGNAEKKHANTSVRGDPRDSTSSPGLHTKATHMD